MDDLSGPEIRKLLEEHLASMRLHSPPESIHALPVEGLRKPEITFWTVWEMASCLAVERSKSWTRNMEKSNRCGLRRDI